MIFFVVQTLKMGELLTVYGLSGLSMLVIQGLKQVVKFLKNTGDRNVIGR